MSDDQPTLETDSRFPSGPWTGFFLQQAISGRHRMELSLTFANGQLRGEGRDFVGEFLLSGRYSLDDGRCHWIKRYLGKHQVFYQGFNEGKGIWGLWEIRFPGFGVFDQAGFHIWPEGMPDPTQSRLSIAADLPCDDDQPLFNQSSELSPDEADCPVEVGR